MSPWLWPLTKPLRMVLLRSPAEGALSVIAGALKPQATSCFGRYMDGEALGLGVSWWLGCLFVLVILLMVQKSHSQPPGMVLKPCK